MRRSLPTLHRYLALRKRMLGLEKLRYQDLYVPIVPSAEMRFEPEEARALTLAAVAAARPRVRAGAARRASRAAGPTTCRRPASASGAYSTGVYGVHPYQLLNFNGRYDDLSTLAHESGHSMHTWLAYGAQPYPTATTRSSSPRSPRR